jgi:hypothetical protein
MVMLRKEVQIFEYSGVTGRVPQRWAVVGKASGFAGNFSTACFPTAFG